MFTESLKTQIELWLLKFSCLKCRLMTKNVILKYSISAACLTSRIIEFDSYFEYSKDSLTIVRILKVTGATLLKLILSS